MIEIKNLTFKYREGDTPTIHDINLHIPDGQFVGITGAAGSGKSTLTYAFNGIIPHCYPGDFYGSVVIDGHDTVDASLTDISQLVGSVCQDIDSQMISSVVEDEMLYGLENFGVPREQIEPAMNEALKAMGIVHLKNRNIASLSGGQKQKVAVAAILALKPRVLVLDEPTTGLDYRECCKVMKAIEKLHKSGKTIVMVCHDMEVVADFADRVIVMTYGEMVADGPTFDILRNSEILKRSDLIAPQIISISQELVARNPELAYSSIARANFLQELTNAIEAFVEQKGGK